METLKVYIYFQYILLKFTFYYPTNMYQQVNIQQFYVLPTQLYLCVLCGSENKQLLFPYIAVTN